MGVFSQQRTSRNNPPASFSSFFIQFCSWTLAQHIPYGCFVPSLFYGYTYSVTSVQQRYLNLLSVTNLPIATGSTAQASFFWFLSICKEVYFFLYKNWHSTELHSPKAIFFVGSFNAKLTSKDERFQDCRNFSYTHKSS